MHRTATFDLQRHRSLPDHELSSPEMWHIQCKKLVSCRALGQTKFHMFTVNGQITWFNKNTQVHDNINSNYRSVSLAQYRRYSKLLAENYKIFHPTYISCPHLVCHCPNLVIAFISEKIRTKGLPGREKFQQSVEFFAQYQTTTDRQACMKVCDRNHSPMLVKQHVTLTGFCMSQILHVQNFKTDKQTFRHLDRPDKHFEWCD